MKGTVSSLTFKNNVILDGSPSYLNKKSKEIDEENFSVGYGVQRSWKWYFHRLVFTWP